MGEFEISSEYFELVKMKPYREKVKILAAISFRVKSKSKSFSKFSQSNDKRAIERFRF